MAEYRLMLLGVMCPEPVQETERHLFRLAPGDRLVVEVDHSCTVRLLRERLRRLPCRFRVEDVDWGVWRFTIERR